MPVLKWDHVEDPLDVDKQVNRSIKKSINLSKKFEKYGIEKVPEEAS